MAWIIASVPFWLLGGWLASAAFACLRHRTERPTDRAGRFMTGMVIAGIFFCIAARVAS